MSPSKDESVPASAPKPAIKGFSLSAKPKSYSKPGAKTLSKPSPASTLGKRPRSTFASHDSDSEDSDHEKRGKHQAVTAFGAEGAVKQDEKRPEGPLVIPMLVHQDWRSAARARTGMNLLPPEVQAAQEAARLEREGKGNGVKVDGVDAVKSNDEERKWGLSVRKKEDVPQADATVEADTNGQADNASEPEPAKPKTADEEALEALLGEKTKKEGPDLVIPSAPADDLTGPVSEADAYRRAIASAPEASTLEDYERVPVEEFGAAMLRGMGWKGPSADGKSSVKEVKRRQNLLGLGAKELKDAEELGAWVQKSDVKRLNSGPDRRGERRPKASEYRREKEKRDEKREERGGGSYRRERERDDYRERDRERNRDRRR
ncbi:Pre-mRNA-splicing factor SPP2 [Hyphodiscus hymeniophilus]|uniref:Pre-mRNA-splicing factor n=1 Tax=Hyphodiscus hymeniophilus TaxID=353542 RepID=A0A9P6VDM7_9HELO|nr:Pre-mRNA-splicing factor SPP2 [Hyphodiscus hymeniophilus]